MSFVIETVLRSSVVLTIGFAALAALRSQAAALRHWVLVATLAMAAAQPAMNRIIPAWKITGLAAKQSTVDDVASVSTGTEFELPVATTLVRRASARIDWIALASRVWLAGVIASLGVLLIGAGWLTWLTSRAADADVQWHSVAEDVRRRLGIRRAIRIAVTQHPALLLTWGVIAPVILLPKDAPTWPADRVQLVLAHEMAHLVRRDWLIQLLAEMLRAIYWFNPLFWVACARLRQESECASDDIVLETGVTGTSYASHLVDLARSFSAHGRTWLPAPSIARPSTLERRVRAMLNPRLNRRPISSFARVVFAVLILAISLPIAAVARLAGSPSGTLRDPQGRVLPGATVRLSAIGTDAVHETQSDGAGAFQFPEIPDGEYMLSARLPGFLSARQRVRVSSANAPLDVMLQVGTLQETITIRGGAGINPDQPSRTMTTAKTGSTVPRCGTTELGGNLKPPMKIKDVRPRYRQAWVDKNVEGNVLLQAVIGVDGKVRNVEVVSAVNADLEEEAIGAVSQWEFSPTWLNCQAIEVRMFVTASFKIDR